MKTIVLYFALASSAIAQDLSGMGFVMNGPDPMKEAAQEQARLAALPVMDPLRVIDNRIWTISGEDIAKGFVQFRGAVLESTPGGIRVRGSYRDFGDEGIGDGYGDGEFFVTNFPYTVADNDVVGVGQKKYIAKVAGTFSYITVLGASRTIRMLDYGTPYVPPPLTPEQIAAAKKEAEAAKLKEIESQKAAKEKALALNEAAAEKGDAYGLLRMGERYRDGEGVEKDPAKARDYLTRAAAAGSPSAEEELAKLNQ